MISNFIDFTNNECKKENHDSCPGTWIGLGFEFYCDCDCHNKRETTDGFGAPTSVAINHTTHDESGEDD